jgi:hypothetical protein
MDKSHQSYDVEDLYEDPIPPNDAWGKFLSMRFSQRPAFYNGLQISEKELIRKEVQRIEYFRGYFKTRLLSPSDHISLEASLEASRSNWRKMAFGRCKDELEICQAQRATFGDNPRLERNSCILKQVQLWESKEYSDLQSSLSTENYIHSLAVQTSHADDNPNESNYGYNGWVIVFEKGVKGITIDHPLCHGQFPNQKISIQRLLYNKSKTPLKRTENKDTLRYFHLPANNMKWVEVRVVDLQLHQQFD